MYCVPTNSPMPTRPAISVCMYAGLSLLFSGGEDDEVEQYLQMSVRWAETPIQHLQAMTNLGMHVSNLYVCMYVCMYLCMLFVILSYLSGTLNWTKFQRDSKSDLETGSTHTSQRNYILTNTYVHTYIHTYISNISQPNTRPFWRLWPIGRKPSKMPTDPRTRTILLP